MPPSVAVPGFGDFKNEVPLNIGEIDTLIRWADAGAPFGSGNEADYSEAVKRSWPFGQPDLIVEPEQPIDVSGTAGIECRCFAVRTRLSEPKSVSVIDVIPGDGRVVYYVRVFADLNTVTQRSSAVSESPFDCGTMPDDDSRISLGEWGPELPPSRLPAGLGRMLPAKAMVVVEIRYQKIGIGVADRTKVGLYFQPARQYVHTKAVSNKRLMIPAGDWDYRADALWTIDRDVTALSISPHMHRLGAEMRVIATLPDGTRRNLVWVRDYDQSRQKAYMFKEPVHLPKGSRVDVTAHFDNSDRNVGQPHSPPQVVRWGTTGHDEMLVAFLEYVDGSL
jgi:hypothetical protein